MAKRIHSPEFKAEVALAAMTGNKTLDELASIYDLHPVQVCQWKKQFAKRLPELFKNSEPNSNQDGGDDLMRQVGRLKAANDALKDEIEWQKKLYSYSQEILRSSLEPGHQTISLRRQCELLGASRSSFYYRPKAKADADLKVMAIIDDMCMQNPRKSCRQLHRELEAESIAVTRNHLHLLLRRMGFGPFERSLFRQLTNLGCGASPNKLANYSSMGQAWIFDMAYWPSPDGERFAAIIVDSRRQRCLAWGLADRWDVSMALAVLDAAISKYGHPAILQSESLLPFFSATYQERLKRQGIWLHGSNCRCHRHACGRITALTPVWNWLKQNAAAQRAVKQSFNEENLFREVLRNYNQIDFPTVDISHSRHGASGGRTID